MEARDLQVALKPNVLGAECMYAGKPKDLVWMQGLRAMCLNRGRGRYFEAEVQAEILASSL